jgi:hypothetical protein
MELLGGIAEAGAAEWSLVLVAPVIGSFLGLLIRRLPDGSPIVRSRSRCDACGAILRARDLVPILSWLAAGGRCRYCRQPLGWFYPGVELAALVVALAAVLIDGGQGAWLDCLLGWPQTAHRSILWGTINEFHCDFHRPSRRSGQDCPVRQRESRRRAARSRSVSRRRLCVMR